MTQRIERVQRLARQILGEEMQNLKDPRIGFATVTAVRMSPDLRYARVYVSVMGSDEEQKKTMLGLESAKSYLRSILGEQMRTKFLPELSFSLDTSPAEAERLERLFRTLHEDGEG